MAKLYTREEARRRRVKFQIFAGMFDFIAVLAGIGSGVVVYGILVIALRILRAEDVRSIPKGEMIIKLLHLK